MFLLNSVIDVFVEAQHLAVVYLSKNIRSNHQEYQRHYGQFLEIDLLTTTTVSLDAK